MAHKEGFNYAPSSLHSEKVVADGEFVFAVAALDHGHIYGQTNGLIEAGATLKYVYDPDPAKVADFLKTYPQAQAVDSLQVILDDESIQLVASAAIPSERCALGLKVLDAGKDYFTDKSPFTSLDQLAQARQKVAETGRKYMVYYSERLHVESAWYAGELIQKGAIGEVVQVLIMAPHRLSKASRPEWFFDKEKYGGILTDIGSHQFEQALFFTGASDATLNFARTANLANSDRPGLEDFGEASLTMDNGASCYCRVDWFTPDGLSVWGDGRVFIVGTKGTMEIRKYLDFGRGGSDTILLADENGEQVFECAGKVGFPFFGQLILDCINRTENAMSQEHAFKAAELSLLAQQMAERS
ncbi:Gfo/Idh/MocA family protein [Persicirhabdus sediminis]|uniref:Gfo/Idh/MocA family oxidoreductase n=1 Tax=Persicirhabdus sediminis TaxID=454144 RepID=A0A8J7MD03_9BACT|nr:Gfo/Idh/MocA family oxidoreductase [Persicirhabdus sediminis]MBK1791102.1 Gfo/Idh/MocA family oxidoreductase [Persicirhabdus sediminis]